MQINAVGALVALVVSSGSCGMPDHPPTAGFPAGRSTTGNEGVQLLDIPLNGRCAYNFQCSQDDAIAATRTSSARAVVCRASGYVESEKFCLHQGNHELISGMQRCDNDADCVDWLRCADQSLGDGKCKPPPRAEEQRVCNEHAPCRCSSGHCLQYGSASCDGGRCLQICDSHQECRFSCKGGGCMRVCAEGSVCYLGCEGGDCITECAQNAACAL